ncbi:MAG: hypothetical protein QF570_12300 [Myxococcota bacterium]|nr:hypothetical protein [Myxococcota bacterium]
MPTSDEKIDATTDWVPPLEVESPVEGESLVTFLGAAGGDEFWSATPTDRENLDELASLLDSLDQTPWTSAETVLHVLR